MVRVSIDAHPSLHRGSDLGHVGVADRAVARPVRAGAVSRNQNGASTRVANLAAAFNEISVETQRMEGGISEVASVAEQSSASAEEVSASTEQTSAATQEIAAGAAELAGTAERLERLVRSFRLSARETV